jgi:hypothetical protein
MTIFQHTSSYNFKIIVHSIFMEHILLILLNTILCLHQSYFYFSYAYYSLIGLGAVSSILEHRYSLGQLYSDFLIDY